MFRKISFLLGSGVSIPAGMPSTLQITEQVLSGKEIMRHTDESYIFRPASYRIPDEYTFRVVHFLNILKNILTIKVQKSINYEEIYYIINQLEDKELRIVMQPFIDKILPDIQLLFSHKKSYIRGIQNFQELMKESKHYIQDIVWVMLKIKPDALDYLHCIKNAYLDEGLSSIDIFTLNHDRIIEKYLSQNNIKFTDGFGNPVNGIKYWDEELFENKEFKIRLFKLHGSIDWFRLRPIDGHWENESIGKIPLDISSWETKDSRGIKQFAPNIRPEFLVGTFNKMLEYTSGIYTTLFCQFYHSLQSTTQLIICGYGFGDKGINNRIIDWLYSSDNHKIIIIHPDPKGLGERARGEISNKWGDLINKNKIIPIPKKIEKTSWNEIKNIIHR